MESMLSNQYHPNNLSIFFPFPLHLHVFLPLVGREEVDEFEGGFGVAILDEEGFEFDFAVGDILLVAVVDGVEHHEEELLELELGVGVVGEALEKALGAESTMVNKLTMLKYNNNPCFYIFRRFSKHFCG